MIGLLEFTSGAYRYRTDQAKSLQGISGFPMPMPHKTIVQGFTLYRSDGTLHVKLNQGIEPRLTPGWEPCYQLTVEQVIGFPLH